MENKSFLRRKWEEFFLLITNKRIAEYSRTNDEVLIIRDKIACPKIRI